MKRITVPGSIITMETAPDYLSRLCKFHYSRELTMEASMMIHDIEERIVNAGLMTWSEIEDAEIAAMC